MIRWCYAFVDRPHALYEAACAFWTAVTDTTRSAPRGAQAEFATLLPPTGDAYVKTQAVGGVPGTHLDLATGDVPGLAARAVERGARVVAEPGGYLVLRSPGGVAFCVVPWHGEVARPPVVTAPDGSRSRLDQVAIDVAPAWYDAEVAFWPGLTGWTAQIGSRPEFTVIRQPAGLPLRLLVQRLGTERAGGMHVDLACADRAATQALHERLGAGLVAHHSRWTVMRDPAGGRYCLTGRDPDTGSLPA